MGNLRKINEVIHASPVAQLVKNPPVMWETWVRSLGWEDPPEKGTVTHSSILAWRIAWTVQSMGSQRVGHDRVTFTQGFPGGSDGKALPAMRKTQVRLLGQEDPLEKGMATHSSSLTWKIPWTEEPGRLQSMWSQNQTRLSD